MMPIRLIRFCFLGLIRLYQTAKKPLAGIVPPMCRFRPTCSTYMYQAIDHHGIVKGLWLGALRIGRCHPLHVGGLDPVPGLTLQEDHLRNP